MKLTKLRYLAAVVQNDLNITTAARKLHTSQPGVSKQLKLLEDELGFPLFEREGRNFVGVTPAGQSVVDRSLRILEEAHNIRQLSQDARGERRGSLSIGTTHTQARYVLPPVVKAFQARFPDIDLHLHQGTSEQIAEMSKLDRIDLAIATAGQELFPGLVRLPAYRWHRKIVVPHGHPLASERRPTLQAIAKYPIVTYTFSFSGRSSLPALFESAGLKLNVALTASDADIIKTYVKLGLGVGIVASMAIDPVADRDLVAVDAEHLFAEHVTWIGFRRGRLLRGFVREFIQDFAPHVTPRLAENAIRVSKPEDVERLFEKIELPTR
jgi:LysR family transcriptional regulator, cys regulon transcriptional activator